MIIDKKKIKLIGRINYLKIFILHKVLININTFLKTKYFIQSHVFIKDYNYPIYIRCGTSDYPCFHLIFIQEEYKDIIKLFKIQNFDLFIDCGMNVGYTTLYFKKQFPKLKVIGVEPDLSNYNLALKNLKNCEDLTLLKQAIWSNNTYVNVIQGEYGDGGQWALKVEESKLVTAIPAVSLNHLLKNYKHISAFVKIDIEGSEKEVLKTNTEWSNKALAIAVELHDDESKVIYQNFLSRHHHEYLGLYSEMSVSKRRDN